MSTPALIKFAPGWTPENPTDSHANLYVHWDGYPEGVGASLYRFLRLNWHINKQTKNPDYRWGDCEYLAARCLAYFQQEGLVWGNSVSEFVPLTKDHPLSKLALGITASDNWDVCYTYVVSCDYGLPEGTMPHVFVQCPYEDPNEFEEGELTATETLEKVFLKVMASPIEDPWDPKWMGINRKDCPFGTVQL